MCLCVFRSVPVCGYSSISANLSVKSTVQIYLYCFNDCCQGSVISLQRPTAKDLLKHAFIRQAKKTAFLVDLIDRYKSWKANHGAENDSDTDDSV